MFFKVSFLIVIYVFQSCSFLATTMEQNSLHTFTAQPKHVALPLPAWRYNANHRLTRITETEETWRQDFGHFWQLKQPFPLDHSSYYHSPSCFDAVNCMFFFLLFFFFCTDLMVCFLLTSKLILGDNFCLCHLEVCNIWDVKVLSCEKTVYNYFSTRPPGGKKTDRGGRGNDN